MVIHTQKYTIPPILGANIHSFFLLRAFVRLRLMFFNKYCQKISKYGTQKYHKHENLGLNPSFLFLKRVLITSLFNTLLLPARLSMLFKLQATIFLFNLQQLSVKRE